MSAKPYATHPPTDATPLFEAFRWRYGSCLLTASVSHLGVFQKLGSRPLGDALFRERLGLKERPFQVLCTGLLAMGLIQRNAQG
ncbi:MAG: methyltransferase, partial [Limisphaerales bacterium]